VQLNYDFDMFSVIPDTLFGDPKRGGFLKAVGAGADDRRNKIALFRDPRTAEALAAAPERVRDFFFAAGFGLNTYASGAPQGCYPRADHDHRQLTLRAFLDFPRDLLAPAPGQAFDPHRFLADAVSAEPIKMDDDKEVVAQRQGIKIFGFSLGEIAGGVALYFVLQFGYTMAF